MFKILSVLKIDRTFLCELTRYLFVFENSKILIIQNFYMHPGVN